MGLSGPPLPVPGQPRGMPPHMSGVAPSQKYPLTNPGAPQPPLNLSGPMPPLGSANTQVTVLVTGCNNKQIKF